MQRISLEKFDGYVQIINYYLVEAFDETVVVLATSLDHACERIGEPLLELAVRLEDVRHEEVHQRPQLHQTVLQRRARQQQAPLRREVQQRLPPLRLEVLDVLRLQPTTTATKLL